MWRKINISVFKEEGGIWIIWLWIVSTFLCVLHYGPVGYCYCEFQFMQCVSVCVFSNPLIEKCMANIWKEVNETAASLSFTPFPFSCCLDVVQLASSTLSCLARFSQLVFTLLHTGLWWCHSSVWREQMFSLYHPSLKLKKKKQAKRKTLSAGISDYYSDMSYFIQFSFKINGMGFFPTKKDDLVEE